MTEEGPSVDRMPSQRTELCRLVEAATWAPSSHNSQPWRFRVEANRVLVLADRTRALPVVDPQGRELVISCGAALFNLVVAARHVGYQVDIERIPEGPASDLLACVTLQPGEALGVDEELFASIRRRHTTRRPMQRAGIDQELLDEAAVLVAEHDVELELVAPDERSAVADLIAEGDRIQFADPAWRVELASWMRPRSTGDGLTVPRVVGAVSRFVVTWFDLGARTAAKDRSLALEAPALAVLGTVHDRPIDWLRTGEALQHLLLHLVDGGVQAGYLNQPCQVAELRPRLAEAVGRVGAAQLLLRLGQPTRPSAPSARRPVRAVTEEATTPGGTTASTERSDP